MQAALWGNRHLDDFQEFAGSPLEIAFRKGKKVSGMRLLDATQPGISRRIWSKE